MSRADAGFEVDTNAVTLVAADDVEQVPLQSKAAVAGRILDAVERLLTGRREGLADECRESSSITFGFYAELGVTGISRDPAWRQRPADRRTLHVSSSPTFPAASPKSASPKSRDSW